MQQLVSLYGLVQGFFFLSGPRISVQLQQEERRSSMAVCGNLYQTHPLHGGRNRISVLVHVVSFQVPSGS